MPKWSDRKRGIYKLEGVGVYVTNLSLGLFEEFAEMFSGDGEDHDKDKFKVLFERIVCDENGDLYTDVDPMDIDPYEINQMLNKISEIAQVSVEKKTDGQ